MALNNFGLGFQITAEDTASGVIAGTGKNLEKMKNKAEDAAQEMRRVGEELKSMGTKMIAVGAAGLAGLGLAANQAGKFQKGITEVGTLVDHAKFSVADMTKITQQMAQTYGGDLDTQVKALYQSISAGAGDARKATDLLNAANKLSIAGNTDQTTAVLGLTKVLNNYGLEFSNATAVSDAFLVAVKGGATTVGELGNSVGEVSASAKAMGLSYQELIGVLGTAATLTRDQAGATAGLKAVFAGIAHPTAEATKEAEKLGISFTAASLRAKGFSGFLKEITSSAKYNADSMNQLFGSQEAVTVMTSLAANNMGALNTMMGDMANAAGGSTKAFEEMSGTFDQQMSRMKASFQVLAVNIGNALLPMIQALVGWVKSIIDWFNNLSPGTKKIITMFLLATSVGLVLVGALFVISGAIMSMVAAAGTAGAVLLVAGKILAGLALGAVVVGIAIAGLKQAFDKNLGGIATFITELYTKLKLAWNGLVQAFSDGGFSGAVLADMQKAENSGVKAFVINVFTWVSRLINFFKSMWTGFSAGIDALGPVFDELVTAFKGFIALFIPAQTSAADASAAFSSYGSTGVAIGHAIATAFGWIVQAISYAIRFATGFWEVMGPALMGVWNAAKLVWAAVMEVAGVIGGSLGSSAGSAGNAFQTLGSILAYAGKMFYWLMSVGLTVTSVLLRAVGGTVSGIIGFFAGMWESIKGIFNLLKGLLTGDTSLMWQGFKQIIFGVIKSVIELLFSMVAGIAGMIDGIAAKLGYDSGLQKGLSDFKNSTLDSIKSSFGLDEPATPVQPEVAAPYPTQGGPQIAAPGGIPAPGTGVYTGNTTGPGAAMPGADAAGGAPPMAYNMPTNSKQEINAQLTVMLDGKVLAETIKKYQTSDNANSFGPTPTTK